MTLTIADRTRLYALVGQVEDHNDRVQLRLTVHRMAERADTGEVQAQLAADAASDVRATTGYPPADPDEDPYRDQPQPHKQRSARHHVNAHQPGTSVPSADLIGPGL